MMAIFLMTPSNAYSWMKNAAFFIEMPWKFVPNNPTDNNPVMNQIMAWCQTGDKPLTEPMVPWLTDAVICHSASMS